jgi:hypothetical protein
LRNLALRLSKYVEEVSSMSKRLPLSAAVAVATLMALPAASQATDCLHLKHLRTSTVAVADDTGRAMRRIGDGVVRAGDWAFGWIFCKRNRV